MKKFLTKTLCVLAVLGYSSIALAACCDSCCPPPPKPQCEPCRTCEICPPCEPCCKPCCTEVPMTGEPCNCAYNAPARIDPACGWKAWGSVSFLYWQAKERGLELTYDYSFTFAGADPALVFEIPTRTTYLDFDYHPAFKLGIGMSECRDDWTFYLEYTRFNASDKKTIYDAAPTLAGNTFTINSNLSPWLNFTDFALLNTIIDFAHAKWTLDYNIFDLSMGRPYYLGRKLVFKPSFGLKAGWIDQKYSFDSSGFSINPAQVPLTNFVFEGRNKQDSWLVGPKVALGTDWLVSCDFRLFVNVAGSLTYQKFKTTKDDFLGYTDLVDPDNDFEDFIYAKDDVSYITPNVDFSLGLGYGSYFCNNEWYLDITVGYDFNYFWNQNQMRHLNDGINSLSDDQAGDLMLHGLNITARVDF